MATGDKTIIANKAYVDTVVSNIDLSTKQDVLVSGTNIKTINGVSLLGSEDIELQANSNVVEYTIAGNETIDIASTKSKTALGFNINIMEENLSTAKSTQERDIKIDSYKYIESENIALQTTLSISENIATLSEGMFDNSFVNCIIYENNGSGEAGIVSVDNNTCVLNIITPFTNQELLSSEWSVYGFKVDNGKLTLSSSNISSAIQMAEYDYGFLPLSINTLNGTRTNLSIKKDSLGNYHMLFYGTIEGNTRLVYGFKSGEYYTEIVDPITSTRMTPYSAFLDLFVDSSDNVHIAARMFNNDSGDTKLMYAYKMYGDAEFTTDTAFSDLHNDLGSNYPFIINETTNGYVDILTRIGNTSVLMYRKTAGVWNVTNTGFNYNVLNTSLHTAYYNVSVVNRPNGAFEIYSINNDTIYIGIFDGESAFTTLQINDSGSNNYQGIAVEDLGTDRRIIFYNVNDKTIYEFTQASSGLNFLTTNVTGNLGLYTKISNINYASSSWGHNLKQFCFDKQGDFVCLIESATKDTFIVTRKDSVWYANYNHSVYNYNNCVKLFAPESFNTKSFTFDESDNIIFLSLDNKRIYKNLNNIENFITQEIIKNGLYDKHPIISYDCVAIDNDGFFHAVFCNCHDSYIYRIPHYITNRGGEISITYNFTNQDVTTTTKEPSSMAIDEFNNVYVLFPTYTTNTIFKLVDGVWTSYAANTSIYTFTENRQDSLYVYHENGNEYIKIPCYVYDSITTRYKEAQCGFVNGLFYSPVMFESVYGGTASGFNYSYGACQYIKDTDVYIFYRKDYKKFVIINSDLTSYEYDPFSGATVYTWMPEAYYNFVDNQGRPNFLISSSTGSASPYAVTYRIVTFSTNGELISNKVISKLSYIDGRYNVGKTAIYSYDLENNYLYIYARVSNYVNNTEYRPVLTRINLNNETLSPESLNGTSDYTIDEGGVLIYNNILKTFQGIGTGKGSISTLYTIDFIESGSNDVKYKSNEVITCILPKLYTKYWLDILKMGATVVSNNQLITTSYSHDKRTFKIYSYDNLSERNIISNDSSVTGLVDGTWYYNSNITHSSETWIESTDMYSAFSDASSVDANLMDSVDIVMNTFETVSDELWVTISMSTSNESYSPSIQNIQIFYDSLSSWYEATSKFTISSTNKESFNVTNNSNETKNIKVVYNG